MTETGEGSLVPLRRKIVEDDGVRLMKKEPYHDLMLYI